MSNARTVTQTMRPDLLAPCGSLRQSPSRVAPHARAELRQWLKNWHFSRFVTLTFNDALAGDRRSPGSTQKGGFVLERLKTWDGLVNGQLLGRNWAKMPADRTFAFFLEEKALSNPHWHGLVRFIGDLAEVSRQEALFDREAGVAWKKLVPAGTSNVQAVTDLEVVLEYVTKSLGNNVEYWNLVIPDQFQGG